MPIFIPGVSVFQLVISNFFPSGRVFSSPFLYQDDMIRCRAKNTYPPGWGGEVFWLVCCFLSPCCLHGYVPGGFMSLGVLQQCLKIMVHQASHHFGIPTLSPQEPPLCVTQTMGNWLHSALAEPCPVYSLLLAFQARRQAQKEAFSFPITFLVFYCLSSGHPVSSFRVELRG